MTSATTDSFVHLHVHTEYSMLDGAARLTELFAETARMGMPALAMTDHGNVFGAYDFYRKANAAGVKPIIGMEAYLTPNTHRGDRTRVRWAEGGENDVSGGGAFTHMTLLAETTEGMHNLFRLASRSSLEGFFYKPRADRELLAQYADGLIGTTGCPSGEIQTWLRIGDYEKARASARRVPGHLRQGQLLPRADGPRARHREAGLRGSAAARRRISGCRSSPPTTCTTRTARTPTRTRCYVCAAAGKTMADPNRFKFDGGGYYLKSPAEMRSLWADKHDLREACDNTLLIAERCDVEVHRGQRHVHVAVPGARGRDRALLVRTRGRRRPAAPLPRRHPARGAEAGRLRGRRHRADELPRLLPRGRRLHQLGQGQRHPGRAGPRLGRGLDGRLRDAHHRPQPARARADLRAVPEPRPRVDARLRHRLRRAPARRGHPLRHREVRQRPRRADRHLRNDQVQAGGQGRRTRARLPVLDGRPHHQGDAARGHGQGRPAQARSSTRPTTATRRAASSAPWSRPTSRSRRSSRRPRGSRGSSGSGACTPPA